MAALEAVPAFWVQTDRNLEIPVIVSLQFFDAGGREVFPPVVLSAIDRTVEATGRCGLAMATVDEQPNSMRQAIRALERALPIPGAILLYRCQSATLAEELMGGLHANYHLSLVRRT